MKPTYVLIHGATQGGWVWKKVISGLRSAGHEVFAPTLTGCGERAHLLTPDVGLETHVQDVTNVLKYEDLQDVILVGHSYGSTVALVVAGRSSERIKHLVFVDGLRPLPGDSMLDVWASFDPNGVEDLDGDIRERGDGWLVMPFHPNESGVTDEADVSWLLKMETPHPYKSLKDPADYDLARVKAIPQTIILCVDEQPVSAETPAWAEGMRYRTIVSGHAVNVIAPEELARLLLEVA